jgi:hypothetical protein
MLPTRFDEITAEDILQLVNDKTAERKTLEYKEKLSINTGDEKCEFLSDVSSFANASGGDIIFGIADERGEDRGSTGVPSEIKALNISNPATECARIEQIIQTGAQPRIPFVQVKSVDVPEHGVLIVIRVGKSWIAPHMVTLSNRSRFYSRNSSTGKFQLDVQQIGSAFASQRGLGELLRDWKTNRIARTISGDGPVPQHGSHMLFHLVSASSLTAESQPHPRVFDLKELGQAASLMSLSRQSERYNVDGFLMISNRVTDTCQYLQIFRDGNLEYGDSYVLSSLCHGPSRVASKLFENKLVNTLDGALSLLDHLEVSEPIFVALTLLGMKGRTMALPYGDASHPFDRDTILCPDILVQNRSEGTPYPSTLLPIVNSVWQAAGMVRTPYIQNGRWNVTEF